LQEENFSMTNERRWQGIVRPYTQEEVERLRPSVQVQHTLATLGAERLWELMQGEGYVQSLGALTGNQAVQQVQAGLKAIYVSGWQVAADANGASHMYPDQSLYPANSVPRWCAPSTTLCCAPTRFAGSKAGTAPTGWRLSWRTRKPDSAAC